MPSCSINKDERVGATQPTWVLVLLPWFPLVNWPFTMAIILGAVAILIAVVTSAPSPQSLKSDVTLLINNDLQGMPSQNFLINIHD